MLALSTVLDDFAWPTLTFTYGEIIEAEQVIKFDIEAYTSLLRKDQYHITTKRHCNKLPCHILSSLWTINAKNQMISLILKIVVN